ncbi:MAG: hypothetical protein WAX14_03155 [Rhodococcus sp. (in: high G+C Gram-positive bacteria)]|uniref:hypothetical protein n=1 Tax=Rhodococcus sp. TaxID=1831 RepID=UPI003BB61C96
MNVSTHIRELIDAIERFGPDAARTQRRALDKLIELDMVVNQEGLTRIWASTGVEDQRLHDRDALAAALKAADVQFNPEIGGYTAAVPLW